MSLIGHHPAMAEGAFTLENWRPGRPAAVTVVAAADDGRDEAARAFQATVLYSLPEGGGAPETAAADVGARFEVDDPFAAAGEAGRPALAKAAGTNRTLISCLLATPGSASDDPKDWTVRWRPDDDAGAPTGKAVKAACVWARPVRIGAIPAVQVFVDRSQLAALLPDGAARVRLSIHGAAGDGQPRRPSSSSFCFRIGNLPFRVRGDVALIERVARYYRELPPAPDEPAGFELRWEGLECEGGASGKQPLTVSRVVDESVRPALTEFLVARLLSEATPSLMLFHGAAIAFGENEKAVLLVGHSGADKTTLARRLLAARQDARLAAEDELLIQTDERPALPPFPRAAALRPPDDEGSVLDWTSFAGASRSKALNAADRRRIAETPPSLAEAEVILLSGGEGGAPVGDEARGARRPAPRARFIVTFAPASVPDQLLAAGLPFRSRRRLAFCERLDFAGALSEAESRKAFTLLEASGGVALSARAAATRAASASGAFPPQPSAAGMAPHEGVKALLDHRLRYSMTARFPSGGETFLKLARCLNGARFHRFTPGGSPDESAQLILKLVEARS